jgi:hypothetical protein
MRKAAAVRESEDPTGEDAAEFPQGFSINTDYN